MSGDAAVLARIAARVRAAAVLTRPEATRTTSGRPANPWTGPLPVVAPAGISREEWASLRLADTCGRSRARDGAARQARLLFG